MSQASEALVEGDPTEEGELLNESPCGNSVGSQPSKQRAVRRGQTNVGWLYGWAVARSSSLAV